MTAPPWISQILIDYGFGPGDMGEERYQAQLARISKEFYERLQAALIGQLNAEQLAQFKGMLDDPEPDGNKLTGWLIENAPNRDAVIEDVQQKHMADLRRLLAN